MICLDVIPIFDFKDLITFGLFLLALLTFVFTFCKQPYIEKPPLNFDQQRGGFSIPNLGQPTLWAVVPFHILI